MSAILTPGRKQVLLALLAGMSLPLLWHGLRPAPPAGLPEAAAVRALPAPRVQSPAGESVEELRSASLRLPHSSGAPGRDPWRFVEAPPLPAVSRSGSPVRSITATPSEPVSVISAPPPVMRPSPFPWQYLGAFGPAGRRIAVFADPARRGEVHNAHEGEALTQGFVLERIGLESVDVRRAPGAEPAQRLLPGGRASS